MTPAVGDRRPTPRGPAARRRRPVRPDHGAAAQRGRLRREHVAPPRRPRAHGGRTPGVEPRRVVGAPPRRRRPGALRQLVAGLLQAGPGARRDRPLARPGPAHRRGRGLDPAEALPPAAVHQGRRRRLRRPDGRGDRDRGRRVGHRRLRHGRPRPADAAAHPAGGARGAVRRRRRRRPAARAALVPGRVRHHPAPGAGRGAAAGRHPDPSRAPRPGRARRALRRVRRHRHRAPRGPHHR